MSAASSSASSADAATPEETDPQRAKYEAAQLVYFKLAAFIRTVHRDMGPRREAWNELHTTILTKSRPPMPASP